MHRLSYSSFIARRNDAWVKCYVFYQIDSVRFLHEFGFYLALSKWFSAFWSHAFSISIFAGAKSRLAYQRSNVITSKCSSSLQSSFCFPFYSICIKVFRLFSILFVYIWLKRHTLNSCDKKSKKIKGKCTT